MLENTVLIAEKNTHEYLLQNSDAVYLTKADLDSLTREEYCLARNEIYAQHVRIFATPQIRDYFESKIWYSGTINGADFDVTVGTYFNMIELANISFISQYEQQQC